MASVEELQARQAEIQTEIAELDSEAAGEKFSDDQRDRWNALNTEHEENAKTIGELEAREKRILELGDKQTHSVSGDGAGVPTRAQRVRKPDNIYDLTWYRQNSTDDNDHLSLLRDGAMRSVETSRFPPHVNKERAQDHIAHLLDVVDQPGENKVAGEIARRVLATGSPTYKRAFFKACLGQSLSGEESRALSVGTGSAGGFAVVYSLDPTMVPTSNYSVNPFRAIARIEQISGTNEWKAVTSGAISAAYAAEATEASDNAPTLAQPDIIAEKAQAFVPFSIEIGQDWGALESSMAIDLSDAKDDLEATKFAVGAGHGSTEPKGLITAATATTTAGGTAAFAIADLYKVLEALPARYRPRAQWLGNLFTFDKIRQFDTAGGSGVWIDAFGQGTGRGLGPAAGGTYAGTVQASGIPQLVGRPAWESTAMAAALTTGSKILAIGDFRYFVIVDRVGMNVEVVPLMVGTNHRPTGQRGLYCYWRNSSDVLSAAAFQVLVTG